MSKKIVLALGGNALGEDLAGQMQAVKQTSQAIADLIAHGHQVVVTHGNGPQVGMINLAFEAAARTEAHTPLLPMSVCVALSQGYIGYDLQNALREELVSRKLDIPVATLITQVEVRGDDEAFRNPSKPIGSFFSKEEAEKTDAAGLYHERGCRTRLSSRGRLTEAHRHYRKTDGKSADGCLPRRHHRGRRWDSGYP